MVERKYTFPKKVRFVSDRDSGIQRVRSGRGFRFVSPKGRPLRDPATMRRIRALAIPPAWQSVWICANANGHIQAVGRDLRGRKQYAYHPNWTKQRDEAKFDRLVAFGKALPKIRQQVKNDLKRNELSREKVIATVVHLLEISRIRVGNDEYARTNGSFGLTTLNGRHVRVRGPDVKFRFRGKSGIWHDVQISDRRVAKVIRQCQDLPGQRLFEYVDDAGTPAAVDSADVNEYLRGIAGEEFSAKDFRTWTGTVAVARALRECGCDDSVSTVKSNLTSVIKEVAKRLGNTPTICRRCYVHPRIIDAYTHGKTIRQGSARMRDGLSGDERAVLSFLKSR